MWDPLQGAGSRRQEGRPESARQAVRRGWNFGAGAKAAVPRQISLAKLQPFS